MNKIIKISSNKEFKFNLNRNRRQNYKKHLKTIKNKNSIIKIINYRQNRIKKNNDINKFKNNNKIKSIDKMKSKT